MLLFVRKTLLLLMSMILLFSCKSEVDKQFLESLRDPFDRATFALRDTSSSSFEYTNSSTVDVVITEDAKAEKWCLSELQNSRPQTNNCIGGVGVDNGWSSTRPETFSLSGGDGTKSVYLWLLKESGDVSDNALVTSIVLDMTAPTLVVTSPSSGANIGSLGITNVLISGTCSEDSEVSISGDIVETLNCVNGSFSKTVDISSLSDGSISVNLDGVDGVGNSATQVSHSFSKDIIPPVITQTTFTNGTMLSADSVTFGGSCENGSTITISGKDTNSTTCNLGLWSYTTSAQTSDEAHNYTFTHTDAAGNSSSVSGNWQRDRSGPTIGSVVIADGATNIGTSFALVKVSATDSLSTVTNIRLSNSHAVTDDCQSEYADDSWQSYSGGIQSYSHQILPGDGVKKVCAWARDSLGNVSVIAPSSGALGSNMDTVLYEVGNPPVVSSFAVSNGTAGPNFGTTTFSSTSDTVFISWTATDAEELAPGPVNLYYTTSSSSTATWTPIVLDYGSIGSGQTSFSGSYASFTSPTTSFFRVKVVIKDVAGNTSVAAEKSLNTGNWSIFAGTKDRGVGGAAASAALLAKHRDRGFGNVVVDQGTNDAYAIDNYNGIYKLDAVSGKVSMFIQFSGATNLVDNTYLSSSSRINTNFTQMAFDKNRLLYLLVSTSGSTGPAKVWQINVDTGLVKLYLGGGAGIDNLATPSTANVQYGAFSFDESNSLYYQANCQGNVNYDRNTSAIRLMKVTQNLTTKLADDVSIVAGDCTRATPASIGANPALTSPIGLVSIPSYGSLATWDNGDKMFYCIYPFYCYKIIGGQIYKSNVVTYRIAYLHEKNKLYSATGSLHEVSPNILSENGDALTEIIESTGTGGCLDDGVLAMSSCTRTVDPPILGPSGSLAFMQGGDNSAYSLRYVDSNNKLQTYLGSKPFYGDGLDKSFARGSISGIYYKKSNELNQAAFPEGLYFLDEKSLIFGRINTSGTVNVLWGNQTGFGSPADGEVMSTASSLGGVYVGGNGKALSFDSQGLPWLRAASQVWKVNSDLTVSKKTSGSQFFELASTGDNPASYRAYVFGGYNNFTMKDETLFLLGAYRSASSTSSAALKAFNFTSNQVTHIMGDVTQAPASSSDDATGGNLANKTFHGYCDDASICSISYDYVSDRLYFSESTSLRYITTPSNTGTSTLGTHVTAARTIRGFILSEDKSQLFYISSDGKLYCKDISSGKIWCNDSSLGPSSGLDTIGYQGTPNQLTWKDSTTLLISTYKGQIYQYNLLP